MLFLRILKCLGTTTLVALAYIHMHMQIIDFAYQGKEKEFSIRQLKERKQLLAFSIHNLKSAQHIGHQLLAKQEDMDFVSPDDVVEISSGETFQDEAAETMMMSRAERDKGFLSWFSFARSAEAKALKR